MFQLLKSLHSFQTSPLTVLANDEMMAFIYIAVRNAFISYAGSSYTLKRQLAVSLFSQGKYISPASCLYLTTLVYPLKVLLFISLGASPSEGHDFLSRLRVIRWPSTNYNY